MVERSTAASPYSESRQTRTWDQSVEMSRTRVKCQVRRHARPQFRGSRHQTFSLSLSCPNPQFVSVLGYECLGGTANIGRHGPSRVSSSPLLSFTQHAPRELSGISESRRRRFYTPSGKSGEEHVTISHTPVQFSCVLSQVLSATSHSSRSRARISPCVGW